MEILETMQTIVESASSLAIDFNIYQTDSATIKETRRDIKKPGHSGVVFQLSSPDGINLCYYNIQSFKPEKITIRNEHPFIQLSYTLSGNKSYEIYGSAQKTTSFKFKRQEFNYLCLPKAAINLQWYPKERLEVFELGISPELMTQYLPEEHPFISVLQKNIQENRPAPLSDSNLFIQAKSSGILYDILNCPLEGRYKQLYIKSKIGELLALELEAYEQKNSITTSDRFPKLKPVDVERMHQVKDIIVSNIQSPCSLIDLAHAVGTNDAYLKRYFKEVFGTTVFGYLHLTKMKEAQNLLLAGNPVTEVSLLTGYKNVSHFTRAFKKHFGINPKYYKK